VGPPTTIPTPPTTGLRLSPLRNAALGGVEVAGLNPGGFLRAREHRGDPTTWDVGRGELLSWEDAGPLVTGVVRCDLVVRGPDVAPLWPHRSRAWKARPGSPSTPDATPMAQVRPSGDGSLLTVRCRQAPMLRACGGHGRRGRSWSGVAARSQAEPEGESPAQDDHLARWQAVLGRPC
jgi:hypothetical protein